MRLLRAVLLCALAPSGQAAAKDLTSPPSPAFGADCKDDGSDTYQTLASKIYTDPLDADLRRQIAAWLAACGDLDGALVQIEYSAALAPANSDIRLAYACILYWLGELEASIRQMEAVAEASPNYPELAALQANLARYCGTGRTPSIPPPPRTNDKVGFRAITTDFNLSKIRYTDKTSEVWSSQQLHAELAINQSSALTASLDREERAVVDVQPKPATQPSEKLRKGFAKRKAQALEAIDAAVRNGTLASCTLEEVAAQLHQIAGIAGFFGEEDLGVKCNELDQRLRTAPETVETPDFAMVCSLLRAK